MTFGSSLSLSYSSQFSLLSPSVSMSSSLSQNFFSSSPLRFKAIRLFLTLLHLPLHPLLRGMTFLQGGHKGNTRGFSKSPRGTLSLFSLCGGFAQVLGHSLSLSIVRDHRIASIHIFGDSIPIGCDFIFVPLRTSPSRPSTMVPPI